MGGKTLYACAVVVLVLVAMGAPADAAAPEQWVTTWGSSQLKPVGADLFPSHAMDHATLRQVVHVSLGGERFRLRLSNVFGERPLVLQSVSVARAGVGPGTIVSGSNEVVRCHGATTISIPAGAEYVSDAIAMPLKPLSDVVVTMLIEYAPESVTFHAGARATSFLAAGEHAGDVRLPSPRTFVHWYFLAGVEVATHGSRGAVVVLGDSITDGHGATDDANDRWPDVLAHRLAPLGFGVVNEGIGGNRILADGLGPSALSRFDRDVLSVAGVRSLILLEGINDLGTLSREDPQPVSRHVSLVEELEGAFLQMITRAHAHGIRVYGGTLTPYLGSDYYHPDARAEADRVALNQWIRTSQAFDGVIDFDAAVSDPARAGHLAPAFDSGDHLHPGPAGYARMGEAVPLPLFSKQR
ncbi:Lysophospholipase L1 [Granulicella pectinivorans]|uniref:Lysophospholipase L1 n=1 Tax=Granulicella pectinivorans TaxID=474950 RepID=A0A1I6MAW0_9BACT|nr:SGNH/GDSL hydrolase family protein [Granulicella pectinivorans]SFS12753.1 Lysophospholipase L1 [Granulicella pectinivorans]